MSGRLDWDKAARRAKAAPPPRAMPRRRKLTSAAQRGKLAALARELGREPSFPKFAADALIEIERLSAVAATRRRLS